MKLIPFIQNNKIIYKCECCDRIYEELPLCFGANVPNYYHSIPEEEREERVDIEKSLCIIDQKYFFHRGSLIIPVVHHSNNLIFDIWTSISQENFEKRLELWDDPKRINEPPYFGWLNTPIPGYGDTLNIKTIAIEQGIDTIPHIQVIEEDHPLAIDQKDGITMDRVLDIVSIILEH